MPSETLRGLISDYILMAILAVILIDLWMLPPDARAQHLPQDVQALDQIQQFNREPRLDRVMHTKYTDAYGSPTVTNDVTPYRRAKLLSEIGKQTETFQRFAAMAAERGGNDKTGSPRLRT